METLVVVLLLANVFLLGLLVMVAVIAQRYGDSSATYKLFAVRDKLIRLDILKEISSDDTWFDRVYKDVNTLLWCSNALSGFKGWAIALMTGKQVAENRICEEDGSREMAKRDPLPQSEPSEALKPIFMDIQRALTELRKNHFGWHSFFNSQARHYQALRKQRAKKLNDLVNSGLRKLTEVCT